MTKSIKNVKNCTFKVTYAYRFGLCKKLGEEYLMVDSLYYLTVRDWESLFWSSPSWTAGKL
jgi:hypothetical protein